MYRWVVAQTVRLLYQKALAGQDTWMMRSMAADVTFKFPGHSSFAADLTGRESLQQWLARFAALNPRFEIDDVVVSGAPWDMTVAVRFHDSIGTDYKNEGVEWLRIRCGHVNRIEVFLDTERITAWESRGLQQIIRQDADSLGQVR